MSVMDVVQSHLECLMQDMLGVDELKVRPDGAVGVSTESGSYTARVRRGVDAPHIEVYSVLLSEIDKDPGLLEKLNDMNARSGHVRLFWTERMVVASGELVGPTAEITGLLCLCEEVTDLVDHCAEEIKKVFGGLLDAEREESE
jgi:hypothetical protein